MLPSISAEDDTIMISALEHYSYCPRQCALIHREQTYDENIYTLREMPCMSGWMSRRGWSPVAYG